MKVVILAGGFGTRISEESYLKPKPMIEIGEKPILWHIMKIYSYYGYNEFIICAGYKQHMIKSWFSDYFLYNSDITFDFTQDQNDMIVHNNILEPWKVTIVDTGLNTMTGGRIKLIEKYIQNAPFLLTYGDGISDVDINEVVRFHNRCDGICTLTGVQPDGKFGVLDIKGHKVESFREKDKEDMGWINGGFMVIEPDIFRYIEGMDSILEKDVLDKIASEGKLNCYKHMGFWQCMDTMRDKDQLEKLWITQSAPWKLWN